jgi:hypothetical protein
MNPIMRGSSSTTRMRFSSRGADRGNFPGLLDTGKRPSLNSDVLPRYALGESLIAEGPDQFFVFASWHHFNKVNSPHWENYCRHFLKDVLYFLVVATARMHTKDTCISWLWQSLGFNDDGIVVSDVQ